MIEYLSQLGPGVFIATYQLKVVFGALAWYLVLGRVAQSTSGIIGSFAFSLLFHSHLTSCFSLFSTFETKKKLANDHAMPGSFHRFLWILPSP